MPSRDPTHPRTLHAARALLADGWAWGVRITLDEHGHIARLEPDVDADSDDERLPGPVLPGMVNAHSHAFQRLIAGLTDIAEHPDDSFWSWREAMYAAVSGLSPDQLEAVTRYVQVEMLRGGYTSVGEFHYVHRQADGQAYARPGELAERVLAAAEATGIGVGLLPVLYRHAGFGGQPPTAGQKRFVQGVDAFLALYHTLAAATKERLCAHTGIALHSLRAVTPAEIDAALAGVPADVPVHIHVAEQQREVDDCLAWSGQRPVQWLLERFPVDARWCLIHATHVTEAELDGLAQRGPVVGLCPTTEANLGDGRFPAEAFGGRVAVGSDSHVSLSPVEELRWLEYSQRLAAQKRNRLAHPDCPAVGEHLYTEAAASGAQAIGQPVGAIAEGRRADFVVLDGADPLLDACPDRHLVNRWLFGVGDRAVRDVWVGGQKVVDQGHHPLREDAGRAFQRVCRELVYA
jgi:formimidoylglutamate deiminase